MLVGEARSGASVGLLLADDEALKSLNRQFRGLDRPTDVLSFPADPEPGADYVGDIAVSMERALEQAGRFGVTFEAEVVRLVVHGLLHLLGYDHHSPAEGRRMKARERRYLEEVEAGSLVASSPPRC